MSTPIAAQWTEDSVRIEDQNDTYIITLGQMILEKSSKLSNTLLFPLFVWNTVVHLTAIQPPGGQVVESVDSWAHTLRTLVRSLVRV